MNKIKLILGASILLLVSGQVNAAVLTRLGGAAAYDDVLDITWVTTADLSNQQLGGIATWQQQVDWAAGLDYLGFDDWRLSSMSMSVPTSTDGRKP